MRGMTITDTRAAQEPRWADSAASDRLWEALYVARAEQSGDSVAALEDAAFRMYLPMARTLARTVTPETGRDASEQAAELGLAHAVLDWRHRTSAEFRRFARSAIIRQLLHH